jgi:transposase
MTTQTDPQNICCVALELSQSGWVCAFSAPGTNKASVHKIGARNVDRLLDLLVRQRAGAEQRLARSLDIVVCYEAGYDGFWLARLLEARGIRTVVQLSAAAPRPACEDRPPRC